MLKYVKHLIQILFLRLGRLFTPTGIVLSDTLKIWMGHLDSNQNSRVQSPLSYRLDDIPINKLQNFPMPDCAYTTGHIKNAKDNKHL